MCSSARSYSPHTGWPQTWKTWKTQGIWKIVKISGKTRGNLNFCGKKRGKLRESEKYVTWSPTKMHSSSFSLLSCSWEKFKISWRTQGKLREFSFSKMWSSCHNFNLKLIIKAVQIVDSSKITQIVRCAWNASSMYPAFRIVPQLHNDTVL